MKVRVAIYAAFLLAVAFTLTACTPKQQNPEVLKERTAQATAALKSNAKAMAAGIREGWSRDKPMDVNSASKDDLISLPGITAAKADRIIAGRPYDSAGQLVTRRVLTQVEFNKISDRVTAKK